MPFIRLERSPLAPEESPVQIYYREYGSGNIPLVFLHGGWGYEVYPFDRQVEAFGERFRIIIPDRSGYGRSTRIREMPEFFHKRAASETITLLDALGIERALFWGHSDGAVIAAILGINYPERCLGLVIEAFHYYRDKRKSREFFDSMMSNPAALGERVAAAMARDHGEDYWQTVLRMNGIGWFKILEHGNTPENDFYDGKLPELAVPAFFLHGAQDPRTEAGEIEEVRTQLPAATFYFIEGGGHSPHSKRGQADECNKAVTPFLMSLPPLTE